MLFSRIYSWIKYKTLPPSVLFLNRLYVERDSKSRRVTTNLGLTFRNSKWSSYARTNINLKNKTDYLYLILRCIFFLFTLIAVTSIGNYYSGNSITQLHYTFLWFVLDADLYMKAAFSSALICGGQLFITSLYNRLMHNLFSIERETVRTAPLHTNLTLPKRLHKPVLYMWLQSASASNSQLFDGLVRDNLGNDLPNLYNKVYSSARLLRLSNVSSQHLTLPLTLLSNKSYVNQSGLFGSYSDTRSLAVILDYTSLAKNAQPTGAYFQELNEWSLSSVHADLNSKDSHLEALEGAFYASSLTNGKLAHLITHTPELATLKGSVETQLASIRWQRWLYKYNLLHRSTLSGTRQIGLAKKLVNSGFYTSSLSTNNIWASSVFNDNLTSTTKIRDLHESLYGASSALVNSHTLSPHKGFMNSSGLENLAFYELSYNWFIQRFYKLNTLSTNQIVLRPTLHSKHSEVLLRNTASFSSASSALEADFSYFGSLPTSALNDGIVGESYSPSLGGSNQNDLYLNYYDNSFLSKSRLELVQNLVKNKSVSAVNFYRPVALSTVQKPNYL